MNKSLTIVERLTQWIGSIPSLIVHTAAFITAFIFGVVHVFPWDSILLILTTVVSLEAIYLAIFIQMSVNQNTESLREVEEDVDEIQKDIDAIEQDVDEIQEDEAEEEARDAQHKKALDNITEGLQKLLQDVGKMQK